MTVFTGTVIPKPSILHIWFRYRASVQFSDPISKH